MQVILYMFANPPISPLLNSLFVKLDSVFPLFGTFAFAVFCFYLIGALSCALTCAEIHCSSIMHCAAVSCVCMFTGGTDMACMRLYQCLHAPSEQAFMHMYCWCYSAHQVACFHVFSHMQG